MAHPLIAHFDLATISTFFGTDFPLDPEEDSYHGIPTAVLAHELCHSWQVTATARGLHCFANVWVGMSYRAVALFGLARRNGGRLPVGMLGRFDELERVNADSEIFFANALAQNELAIWGGLRLPLDEVRQASLDPLSDGRILACDSDFDKAFVSKPSYFVDCGDHARLLGLVDLMEGMATAAQTLCSAIERHRGDGAATGSNGSADPALLPYEPYHVAFALYSQNVPALRSEVLSVFEFAVVVDTALMMDDWSIMVGSGQDAPIISDVLHPFAAFCELIVVLRQQGSSLRLTSPGRDAVRNFQNALLEAASFSVPDVGELTRHVISATEKVFAQISQSGPVPRPWSDRWQDCFLHALRFREFLGGGAPLTALATGDRALLCYHLEESTWLHARGLLDVTDSSDDNDHQAILRPLVMSHISDLMEQMTFGSSPCMLADQCGLERRPSCFGISERVAREGERCARELATLHLMKDFDLVGFSHPY